MSQQPTIRTAVTRPAVSKTTSRSPSYEYLLALSAQICKSWLCIPYASGVTTVTKSNPSCHHCHHPSSSLPSPRVHFCKQTNKITKASRILRYPEAGSGKAPKWELRYRSPSASNPGEAGGGTQGKGRQGKGVRSEEEDSDSASRLSSSSSS